MPYKDINERRACKRKWAKEHPETGKRIRSDRIARNHQYVKAYKLAHPCVDCGESDPLCLDFDHRDKALKERAVSYMVKNGYSISRIDNEISKCEIRCANCHRKRHHIDGY